MKKTCTQFSRQQSETKKSFKGLIFVCFVLQSFTLFLIEKPWKSLLHVPITMLNWIKLCSLSGAVIFSFITIVFEKIKKKNQLNVFPEIFLGRFHSCFSVFYVFFYWIIVLIRLARIFLKAEIFSLGTRKEIITPYEVSFTNKNVLCWDDFKGVSIPEDCITIWVNFSTYSEGHISF